MVPDQDAPLTDDELVRRLRLGDEAALATAYDRFATMVHAVATRVCGERHAAEDVTQQVFLHLWTSPGVFDGQRGSLRGWLAVLAHRRAVDWVRRETVRSRPTFARADLPTPSAEEQVLDATVVRRVAAAVDHLPTTYRDVVRMLYYEELPVREIADRLGIPEGTTKTRLRAARRRLAAELGAAGWAGAW